MLLYKDLCRVVQAGPPMSDPPRTPVRNNSSEYGTQSPETCRKNFPIPGNHRLTSHSGGVSYNT